MKSFEVVVVGAGPAGMAAALAARRCGKPVAVIDDNQAAGGQIWRGQKFMAFTNSGADLLFGRRVIDADPRQRHLTLEDGERLGFSKLVLATGARELFLPFPGWTLPGIFGVGGLQALAKSGLPVEGKRILIAGSGPLLLAVGAYMSEHGAHVAMIAEQAGWMKLASFGAALLRHPDKIRQAMQIRKTIPKVKYRPGCWVIRASGHERVEEVTLQCGGKTHTERCDYLAVAYGFVPSTELAQILGCRMKGAFVAVDKRQQTSVDDVFCAGEPTSLGGVDEAVIEGEIAGFAACGQTADLDRRNAAHFTRALNAAFALRHELRGLPDHSTIVCRCEDVSYGKLREADSWREAKLHFRCGMGPCQGRVCGPAVEYLMGWRPESVRPPIFPACVESLINEREKIGI